MRVSSTYQLIFDVVENIKRNSTVLIPTAANEEYFRGTSTNEKFAGINFLNAKWSILKKINVSFLFHFCFCKYSFSFDTVKTYC